MINADGSQRRRLGPGTRPDCSPDGKRIVLTKPRTEEGIEYPDFLHVMDADGSHVRSLGLAGMHPSWSPDGTKVAFVEIDDPDYGCGSLRITELDGARYVIVPSPGCYVYDPNWSPNGKRIAFSSNRGRNTLDQGIFVVNADGSGLNA